MTGILTSGLGGSHLITGGIGPASGSGIGHGVASPITRGLGASPALLTRGLGMATATTTPAPLSTQGAIVALFNATPSLVAAVPGKLLEAIPSGPTPLPYATITHIAGVRHHVSGGRFYRVDDHFQVTIYGQTAALKAALALFDAAFNPATITGITPLRLRSGSVFAACIADETMARGIELDKNNRPVYRQMFTLMTKSSHSLN